LELVTINCKFYNARCIQFQAQSEKVKVDFGILGSYMHVRCLAAIDDDADDDVTVSGAADSATSRVGWSFSDVIISVASRSRATETENR